jgi:hypothetical protein
VTALEQARQASLGVFGQHHTAKVTPYGAKGGVFCVEYLTRESRIRETKIAEIDESENRAGVIEKVTIEE